MEANELRRLLNYDPKTGIFRWRVSRGPRAKVGAIAGCVSGEEYTRIRLNGKLYRGHRLAWLYMTGEWPPVEIDHVDCNKSNSRFTNLRKATILEQRGNKKRQSNNTSGAKGVCWHKAAGKWFVQLGGRSQLFDSIEEAATAYAVAARKHFGEFARME